MTFQDNFRSLNTSLWTVSDYTTDNYAGGGSNVEFSPKNITFPGCLCMKLTQPTVNFSSGAEILSKEKFHFGVYEFSLKAGSTSSTPGGIGTPVSGGVSSSFILDSNRSITEIDSPEIEGIPERSDHIEFDIWKNGISTPPTPEFTILPTPEAEFNLYKFIWTKNKITFYINNQFVSVSKSNIPTTPAWIDLNFYGTNSLEWGGLATVGVTRYMYVNHVSYQSF